jgi:hypothetical protein
VVREKDESMPLKDLWAAYRPYAVEKGGFHGQRIYMEVDRHANEILTTIKRWLVDPFGEFKAEIIDVDGIDVVKGIRVLEGEKLSEVEKYAEDSVDELDI